MFYMVCFIISTFFFAFSEKAHRRIKITNRIRLSEGSLFGILGIVVLTFPASFRATCVGTDVMSYVYYAFERIAERTSVFDVLKKSILEPLYELLCYISYRIFPDLHMLHFLTALIIVCCVYYFVKSFSKNISVSLAMLCFMLLHYNTSLNIVRQYLAIGFSLVALKAVFHRNKKTYLFFCVVAVFFHSSALVCFLYYPIYALLNKNKDKKARTAIILIAVILFLLVLKPTVTFLANIGLVPYQYVGYFSSNGESSILMQLLSRITTIILGIMFYKKMDKYDNRNHYLFCFLLIDAIIGLLTPIIGPGARLSLYFGIVQCVYIPELCKVIVNNKNNSSKWLANLTLILALLAYWIFCVPIRNFGNTYPYVSDVISWL